MRRFEAEAAVIREKDWPEYEALLGLPKDELEWKRVELHTREDAEMAGPMTRWQLRDFAILAWCERNGLG